MSWQLKATNELQFGGDFINVAPGQWRVPIGGLGTIVAVVGTTGLVTSAYGTLTWEQIFIDGDLTEEYNINTILRKGGGATAVPDITTKDGATSLSYGAPIFPSSWSLQPAGLSNGVPSFGGATTVPAYLNQYNGRFPILQQLTLYITCDNTAGVSNWDVFFVTDLTDWQLSGGDILIPPPPNVTLFPVGGISFGGSATLRALTDASGIYTLIPGQYHDELYQRVGTTASTINVVIPTPFFKTGFIKG